MTTGVPGPRSVAIALALFRRVTVLLPPRFRERHLGESLALMQQLLDDAHERKGGIGVLFVTATAILDLIRRLPAAHLAQADVLRRDVRHGLRALRRRPLSTTSAIATLAIGIGLNAAVFSVFDWVLLRPLPYPAPEELVRVFTAGTAPITGPAEATHSEFEALRRAATLRSAAAFSSATRMLGGPGLEPAHVLVTRVAGDFFGTLAIQPAIGRGFTGQESLAGAPVIVLSESLWRSRFEADPLVVGRIVAIDRRAHTVIGVMPAGRGYPATADLWRPLTADEREDDDRELVMLGRLAPGATANGASAELASQAGAVSGGARRAWVEEVQRTDVRDVRMALTALLVSSALVLLMACANVAALVGARDADRAAEMALRGALGASRPRLVRQLLTESALLAIAGGGAGLLLGAWALRGLVALAPAAIPRVAEIALDGRVVAIGMAVTFVVGLAVGLAPAYRATRVDLRASLAGTASSRARRRPRARRLLVAGQMALAVVVTIGAGLLARSMQHLVAIDHGFEEDRLLAVGLYLRTGAWKTEGQDAAGDDVRTLYRELVAAAEAVPGVKSAAVAMRMPHQIGGLRTALGGDALRGGARSATLRPVTERYFETAGIPVLEGRAFATADLRTSPRVAIVNRAFAVSLLGGGPALGVRVTSDLVDGPVTIVGIVGDVTPAGEADRPALYVSEEQVPVGGGTLLVRTAGDPLSVVAALTARMRDVASALPRDRISRVADALEAGRAVSRFNMQLASAFAALALALAAIGVYGLTAGEVASRWRELAVRLALGATRAELLWTVMRPGALVLSAGVAAGIALALGAGRWLSALLHGITAADPLTLVAVPAFLGLVGIAAALLAAARVLRADPATTLRLE